MVLLTDKNLWIVKMTFRLRNVKGLNTSKFIMSILSLIKERMF